mmetsp:Transcript_12088/g.15812  ORF Transcript_12088/g.15812 Transcript_12088/m.15812 type:complete len:376 (+) Transcript_12088:119-1246(+)
MTIITKFPRTQTKLWTLFLHVIVFSARVTCFQLSMASTRPVFRETRVFTELKTIGTPNKLDDTTLLGGQTVSCLGVGAWAWGDKLFWGYDDSMNQELEEVYNSCLDLGINLFDTAEVYGFGKSEYLCGKFKRKSGKDAVIASKFAPLPFRLGKNSVVNACKASLERMGLDSMELYQLHWPAIFQDKAYWDGLAECYEQGLVKSVGVSNYGAKAVKKVHKHLADRGVPLASNQIQYSLLSRGPEYNGIMKTCKELDVKILAYSPLAQGLLTGKYSDGKNLPTGPRRRIFKQLVPRAQPIVDKLKEIGEARDKTPAQVALNWCICQGTIPIPGAKNVKQATENAEALGWRLSEDELVALKIASTSCKIQLPTPLQNA